MTRLAFFSIAFVVLALGMGLSGCSDDNPTSGTTDQQALVNSTSPRDGATDVPTSSPIVIAFNTSMDTMSVMEYFHCAGGAHMWEWMDSLQDHHTGMGGHMTDMDHMMAWMRDIELPGRFAWNNEKTRCVFHPDTGLLPHTDYMIYLEDNIRSHDGHMMDQTGLAYGGLMIHFRTGP